MTWASSVVNTAVLLPSFPSFTVKVPGVGFWLVAASSGGGLTQRYAVGGARPSRSGPLESGLRCPDRIALAAYTRSDREPGAERARPNRHGRGSSRSIGLVA